MKQIIITVFAGLILASCTKKNDPICTGRIHYPLTQMLEGGEDGDIVIINHKVVDINGSAIQGCKDTLTKGTDTFTCTTNEMGMCVFQLPDTGTWYLHTGHNEYRPLHAELQIAQSGSTRIDTMYIQ